MRAVLAALVCALATAAAGAEIRVRDDRGVEVALPGPAQRIVALAPHLVEIAFAAGAGERVVGVPAFADHPPAAAQRPVVSDATHLDLEALARLKPDLVLVWRSGNPARFGAQLEARGYRTFATEPQRLSDIARIIRAIGQLAGTAAEAERSAADFEARVAALRGRYGGRAELGVFYEIWDEPLMTLNGRHLISELIALCGGRNLFAGERPLTPVVSREQVLAADPDVILVSAPPARAAERLDAWRRWASLRAARRDAIVAVDPSLLNRSGPRVADGAAAVCEALDRVRAGRAR